MTTSFVGLAGHKAEINVTPMIDVLLVLIIIFMIITPLAPTGLRTLIPQSAPADKEQPVRFNDIVITVERDKTVLLNRVLASASNSGAAHSFSLGLLAPFTDSRARQHSAARDRAIRQSHRKRNAIRPWR